MMEPSLESVSVLVVDDHPLIREGVCSFLQIQPDISVVGQAASGREAVLLCDRLQPDVVLMDLVLPEMDGIAATREIKRVSPRVQVIVLTSYHDDTRILPAIRAGALSYLLKDVTAMELVTAIRKAARGEVTLSSHVAAQMMRALGAEANTFHEASADLSERELEVLRLIADGNANAAIAEHLFISERTVKSHVSNILSKLQLADRTQAAVYAWKEGIVYRDSPGRK